jgi:protein-tyrosine-phosphatase
MMHVVFICTGNICRSPMAEGLLRKRWEENGYDGLIVSSMGIHGLDRQEASAFAREICEENNIDIASHRSRKLDISELESSDLILSMEKVHKEFLKLFFPRFDDKNSLLGAWPDAPTRKSDIRDPMGKSKKTYQQVFTVLSGHIDRIIPVIRELYF